MARCYDEGVLRAYQDGELPAAERATIAHHLNGCAACRARREDVRAAAQRAALLLTPPTTSADPAAALARIRSTIASAEPMSRSQSPSTNSRGIREESQLPIPSQRTTLMQTMNRLWTGPRRTVAAAIATGVIAIALLLLPPVRAVADQLLQVFRVQTVVFMPISEERVKQLRDLEFEGESLFLAEPKLMNNPADPQTAATPAEAGQLAGFPVHQPGTLPNAPTSTEIEVQDRRVMQFTVNVQAARQLFSMLGITDVTLPDALSTEPIVVSVPRSVETHYSDGNYDVRLIQGPSPNVQLPDGVDLAQLGKAGLRLLGVDAATAENLSRSIDWSSTLVFPFPSDIGNVRKVTVGNAEALLVGNDHSTWQLYWQNGDRFYMLQADGMDEAEIITAAESVR